MKPILVLSLLTTLGAVASADHHDKPSAPVVVTLEPRAIAGGYQITLVAVPTVAVPAIELRLDGKRVAFAATRAGQRRELTVKTTRTSFDIVGSATANGRMRAQTLRVGAPAAKPAEHVVTRVLPDGRTIAEVR